MQLLFEKLGHFIQYISQLLQTIFLQPKHLLVVKKGASGHWHSPEQYSISVLTMSIGTGKSWRFEGFTSSLRIRLAI
jgi:hypothetical protein